jgi:hypothetical protein
MTISFLVSGSKFVCLRLDEAILQAVEQQAGGLLRDLTGEQQLHDLHDRELDGVGVFEHGQGDAGRPDPSGASRVDEELALVPALMEVAEALFLEGGRATLGAVDLEVAAAGDVQAEGAGEFVGFGLLFRMGLLRGSMHGYTAPGSDLLESWG